MGTNIGQIFLQLAIDKAGFKKSLSGVQGTAKSAGQGLVNTFRGTTRSIQNDFSAMGKKIGGILAGAFAVKKIVDFGKSCIDLGSNLAEVQNVVDVTFPHLSAQVDNFAKSAAQSFGLSETMAKKFTGTFGAMAKAFGFTEAQALEMSTTLTGLAGDVASFYNISQDEAYVKLKSVFSGETETLKDLGIVMTQNALDAYAMANGYGKVTAKMSEAEKVALRYAFVQEQLTAATGDFARTSDSWANQVRLLSLQFDSLKATIGQGLINLFTPILKVINAVIGKLMTLANAFKAFTEMITGKKSQNASAGTAAVAEMAGDAAAGLSDASSSAGDLSKKTDGVGKAAKKAAKELQGLSFDQINKLPSEKDSDTGSSGGIGSSGIGGAGNFDFGSLNMDDVAEQVVGDAPSKLRDIISAQDWKGLGKYLAEKINSGIKIATDAISWEKLGPKITGFVNAVTTGLNSFVDNIDFNGIGKFLGTGINTIVNTLLLAVTGFDFKNLGKKLAQGLNGLVKTVDWSALGKLLGSKFMISWNLLFGFVKNLNWSAVGTALGDGLNGIVKSINLSEMADSVGTVVNGLSNALLSAVDTFDWKYVGVSVYEGVNTLISTIDWGQAAASISSALMGLLDTLLMAIQGIDWAQIGLSIWEFIANIDWAGLLNSLFELIGSLIIAAGDLLLGFLGGLWDSICEVFAPVGEWFGSIFSDAWQGIQDAWAAVVGWFGDIWSNIQQAFSIAGEWFSGLFSGAWSGIQNAWSAVTGWFGNCWSGIKNGFSSAGSWFSNLFSGAWTGIQNAWSGVKNWFGSIWTGIKNTFSPVTDWFKNVFSKAWEAVKNVFSAGGRIFDGIKDGILSGLKAVINAIITGINKVIALPFNGINAALNGIRGVNILGFEPFSWLPSIGVPQIPMLATGGYVQKNTPQLAMIGDNRHQGEVVAPEDKLLQMAIQAAKISGDGGITKAELESIVNTAVMRIVAALEHMGFYVDGQELAKALTRAQGKLDSRMNPVKIY